METNLLVAIKNLIENPITNVVSYYESSNRANSMGDALECYIKDLFCGTIEEGDLAERNRIYAQNFSWLGNQNNPPDVIIKGGDAIEIKKVEAFNVGLALNSSYPKAKLFSNSTLIASACRDCESWTVKDIIYTVGVVKENDLKSLWFVYGDCYAAEETIYTRIKEKITEGVSQIPGIEFAPTNEISRINKVDPLGITYLRVRGMWGISNPSTVFNYTPAITEHGNLFVNVIMKLEKYNSFPEADRQSIEGLVGENFSIIDIQIKSPNNPAQLINAKLITFKKVS